MKFYRDLVALFSDSPSDKIDELHQPPKPKPEPTLGHASFRPYAEPLLQPKNGTNGSIYNIFENSFLPMDKKISLPNQHGVEELQRVITPSKSSTENLFEVPPSDLLELLPDGARKDDYLPAIKLAIKLTTWKQSLQQKARRAWTRWKSRNQKVDEFVFPDWNREAQEHLPSPERQKQAVDEWLGGQLRVSAQFDSHHAYPNFDGTLSADPILEEYDISGFTPFNVSDYEEKSHRLESAYNALKGVLYDYQCYGLLHYRPLADSSRLWASKNLERGAHQPTETFQTIIKVIASWALVYDIFTPTRIYSEVPSWLEHSWEGYTLRKYADLHRQMQVLPSCLVFNVPLFPNPRDGNYTKDKDTYFDEIVQVVTKTADFLSETLEAALRKTNVAGSSHPESQTLENFRIRITHILSKGSFRHPPAVNPGPLFLRDDLRKMPAHLVEALPHHGSNDDLIVAAIDAYQANLLQMEAVFSEVVNFPGTSNTGN